MKEITAQNLLAANAEGRRVTIGLEAPDELRRLSDVRALTCPGCGGRVVLHAGTVRAHHFAHLPGAICRLPQSEPETEEHRAGKLLLARWLRARLPDAEVIVEAWLPEIDQRADVLIVQPMPGEAPRRVALEFQCANLTAREWRRRHRSYRSADIADLWLLGGSRCIIAPLPASQPSPPDPLRQIQKREEGQDGISIQNPKSKIQNLVSLRTTELERALLRDGAPLLFLDSIGNQMAAERLARFRPDAVSQATRPAGTLSGRPLHALDFPWSLLNWPANALPDAPGGTDVAARPGNLAVLPAGSATDELLWQWLVQRFMVTPETLPPFFGLPLAGQEAFACTAQAWQAGIYYRFIHRRVGENWWLNEVETWARASLPLARPVRLPRLRATLAAYQEALGAAGMLSLPMGYGRVHARITADLNTLPAPPDPEETLRLARYRRTLARETAPAYDPAAAPIPVLIFPL